MIRSKEHDTNAHDVECPRCGFAFGGEVEEGISDEFDPQDSDLDLEHQDEDPSERRKAFADALRRRHRG